MTDRDRFEAWAQHFDLRRFPEGDYADAETRCAWAGWQAALVDERRQMLQPLPEPCAIHSWALPGDDGRLRCMDCGFVSD